MAAPTAQHFAAILSDQDPSRAAHPLADCRPIFEHWTIDNLPASLPTQPAPGSYECNSLAASASPQSATAAHPDGDPTMNTAVVYGRFHAPISADLFRTRHLSNNRLPAGSRFR